MPPYYPYYPPPVAMPIDDRGFWDKYKYLVIGAAILVLLIIIGLIIRAIVNAVAENRQAPDAPDYEFNTDPETGEIIVTNDPLNGYDVRPMVEKLKKAMENCVTSWSAASSDCNNRCAVMQEAANLSTNQLIAVAIEYKKQVGRKLYEDLSGLTLDGCGWFSNDTTKTLMARLETAKLS